MERAHARLNRCGHHQHIAKLVNDGHVGGALALGGAAALQACVREHARHRSAHAFGGGDKQGAAFQIVPVQQRVNTAAGQGHKVGVGHVLVAVGIGQALSLAHQVHAHDGRFAALGIDDRGAIGGQVKVVQDAQGLRHSNAARRRWPHAADHGGAVIAAHRRAADGSVVGQVAHLRQTWRDGQGVGHAARGNLDFVHDGLGNRPRIKRIRTALCQRGERGGVGRIFDGAAQRFGGEISIQKIGCRFRVAQEIGLGDINRSGHAPADGKAVGSQFNGRIEQARPR